jgi:hypothetical protein
MPTYDVKAVAAPMPNLDNLRKQAKQYLRWHRERIIQSPPRLELHCLGFGTSMTIRCWAPASSSATRKSLSRADWV